MPIHSGAGQLKGTSTTRAKSQRSLGWPITMYFYTLVGIILTVGVAFIFRFPYEGPAGPYKEWWRVVAVTLLVVVALIALFHRRAQDRLIQFETWYQNRFN
jgi:hypothetical protein